MRNLRLISKKIKHLVLSFKAMQYRLFREPDTRNWKSSDIQVPVNNFVKTHKYF